MNWVRENTSKKPWPSCARKAGSTLKIVGAFEATCVHVEFLLVMNVAHYGSLNKIET